MLAKKLDLLKFKLKNLSRSVFGHLDTRMADLADKVKLLDAKELLSLTRDDRVERLNLRKEIALVHKWIDIFWRQIQTAVDAARPAEHQILPSSGEQQKKIQCLSEY